MIRGTTPILRFILPLGFENIAELFLTIAQNGRTVIEKSFDEVTIEGRNLTYKMTQSETLSLNASQNVEIQLRVKMTSGDAFASEIFTTTVDRILKDGEI